MPRLVWGGAVDPLRLARCLFLRSCRSIVNQAGVKQAGPVLGSHAAQRDLLACWRSKGVGIRAMLTRPAPEQLNSNAGRMGAS